MELPPGWSTRSPSASRSGRRRAAFAGWWSAAPSDCPGRASRIGLLASIPVSRSLRKPARGRNAVRFPDARRRVAAAGRGRDGRLAGRAAGGRHRSSRAATRRPSDSKRRTSMQMKRPPDPVMRFQARRAGHDSRQEVRRPVPPPADGRQTVDKSGASSSARAGYPQCRASF